MNKLLQKSFAVAFLLLATTSMSGCGKGFSVNPSSSLGTGETGLGTSPGAGGTGAGSNDTPPVSKDQKWQNISNDADGQISQGTYSGKPALQIDKERQSIVVLLPLPSQFFLPISSMPIPELPGASLEMITNPDGSTSMGAVIPLQYLLKGSSFATYGRLPNGEPLPGMPVGEAHGFAMSFPQKPNYRLHIYIAVNAVAVFVETPDFKLPPEFAVMPTISIPIKNREKTRTVGYFAVVPNRGTFSSGVYISTRIPNALAVAIDDVLRF